MTTRKRLAHRRAVNQRLAEQDAKSRCTLCKRGLTGARWKSLLLAGSFCSEDCLARSEDLEQMHPTCPRCHHRRDGVGDMCSVDWCRCVCSEEPASREC